ncbi:hypothetical protein MP228_009597 [Amoeboaphelidium protococcarum]|nr:hypothetical protein MP228_009597 [Amoeboaphelidium protococcarum]
MLISYDSINYVCLLLASISLGVQNYAMAVPNAGNYRFQQYNAGHLFKRSASAIPFTENVPTDVGSLVVSAQDLKGRSTTYLGRGARQIQLSYIGFQRPADLTAMIMYVRNVSQNSFIGKLPQTGVSGDSAQLILNDPYFGNAIKAVLIGFVMAVLVPVGIIGFCILRVCCNTCGGKNVKKGGYSLREIQISFGAFGAFAVLNIAFASLLIALSNDVTFTIGQFKQGTTALTVDAALFVNNSLNGIANAPNVAADTLTNILYNMSASNGPLATKLNQSVALLVNNITFNLNTIASNLDNAVVKLNQTQAQLDSLKANVSSLPATFNGFADQMDALSVVQFNGTNWTVPNFPSSGPLRSVTLPDFNNLPNITDFIQQIQGVDVRNTSNQISNTFSNLTSNFTAQILPLINSTVPQLRASLNSSVSAFNQSQADFSVSAQNIQSQASSAFDDASFYYKQYGALVFGIEAAIILIPLILTKMCAFAKRPAFMITFPVAVLLMSSIVWLQYSIFYIVSAPLNVACDAIPVLLNHDYTGAEFNANFNASFLQNVTVGFNPQLFLDSCRKGNTLFNASINSKDDNAIKVLNQIGASQLDAMTKSVSALNVSGLVSGLNISGQVGSVNTSFANFNASKFDFPTLVNTTSIDNTLNGANNTAQGLTAASFSADQGNAVVMQQKLDAFNSRALSVNSSWTNYTFGFLAVNKVDANDNTFDPTVVTGSPSDPENQPLTADYYEAYWRVLFIRQANQAISKLQSNVTTLVNDIKVVQNNQVAQSEQAYATIRSMADSVSGLVNLAVSTLNVVKNLANQLQSALDDFATWVQNYLLTLASSAVSSLINNLFVSNPDPKFGECKPVAEAIQFMVDATCQNANNTLSGFWLDNLLLGIFLVFGFITTMILKKRVSYMAYGASEDDLFAKSEGKKDSGKKQSDAPMFDNIQASAPMVDSAPFDDNDQTPSADNNAAGRQSFSGSRYDRRSSMEKGGSFAEQGFNDPAPAYDDQQ